MNKLIMALCLFMPFSAFCEVTYCEDFYISDVWVQGDRDDNSVYQNSLVIRFQNSEGTYLTCGGKDHLYLENTAASFSGMLSIALSAQISGKSVDLAYTTKGGSTNSNKLVFIKMQKK